jgi:hypothetical protein
MRWLLNPHEPKEIMTVANANYYVSAVEYNSDSTHISKLRVHPVKSDGSFDLPGTELTRPKVVELIKQGKTFRTITRQADPTKWSSGALLEIIPVETEYLKTKKDSTTKDNLENLPKI